MVLSHSILCSCYCSHNVIRLQKKHTVQTGFFQGDRYHKKCEILLVHVLTYVITQTCKCLRAIYTQSYILLSVIRIKCSIIPRYYEMIYYPVCDWNGICSFPVHKYVFTVEFMYYTCIRGILCTVPVLELRKFRLIIIFNIIYACNRY